MLTPLYFPIFFKKPNYLIKENLTIAFVGSGNIASSMIGGLITNGINPEKLIAADSDKTQQKLIADKYGVRVYDKNYDAAKEADVIVFAVKPQIMQQVVKEISKNPDAAYEYTSKGNLVAVISNGSAILGLGDLGALASKPVMEGKAVCLLYTSPRPRDATLARMPACA